jgi:3-methyladenine DNA glycosylase/8-oxoguanine DNA glycosylase
VHPLAKRRRFDRMFRSPTLFEDMVKTITSCNVTWRNTIAMNRLMVEHVGNGGFPTPEQLADYGEERLKARCKVGYRAERIVRLARAVADGNLDLARFEDPTRTSDELYESFRGIHGLGPYAAANLCHLVGRYDRLPIDTETYRHFCLHFNVKRPKGNDAKGLARLHRKIEKHYAQFAPYPFLAYWFELWEDYQSRKGPAWRWDRDTTGTEFTAALLQ